MPDRTARMGADWLADTVDDMPVELERLGPVEFNERNRYLPQGLSPRPGFIRYDLFPYLREPLECFDTASPVREVNFMKGVQVGYTTLLESIILYYLAHIRSQPLMFLTADKELATGRVENNILPMVNESGFADRIRSADTANTRKTGKTKDYIQWDGGGFMIYNGALNATKMRQYSVPVMLKDELDGWKRVVGQDGDSDTLTDARLSAYWSVRKIMRGSTPLMEPSMIGDAYYRGDQRQYRVRCKSCNFPQSLKMEYTDKETGLVSGFAWELDDGALVLESVRYLCQKCAHPHYEHDKEKLFSAEGGAFWEPTARPAEPGIRSYHLPAFYSPFGFRPWSKCVADWLAAYDPATKTTRSVAKLQEFYNNTLGRPFRPRGARVYFHSVSAHRRTCYRYGEIPNRYAAEYSGSPILFLACTVDVHERSLAVTVQGVCRDLRTYTVLYQRIRSEEPDAPCSELASPAWGKLRALIEETEWVADDGKRYRPVITLVDAGYANDTVTAFCGEFDGSVLPILGRSVPAKNQKISEFAEFKTKLGTTGYRVLVDHYKDRLAPVLRREWSEAEGLQGPYHFNAPMDMTDDQIKELTREYRRPKRDAQGQTHYEWHRPGGSDNELWDLLVYTHAAAEILAWTLCIDHFGMEKLDWGEFWRYLEAEKLYFTEG